MDRTTLLGRIRQIEVRSRKRLTSKMLGNFQSISRGRGLIFDTVRPYEMGDNVRDVDWNVTARTGELHVKQYVEDRQHQVMLLVDVSQSMGINTTIHSRTDAVAEVAATIAWSVIANKDAVGLITFAEHTVEVVRPANHQLQLDYLLKHLLLTDVPNPSAKTSLEGALNTFVRLITTPSFIFILSDFQFDLADSHDLLRYLARFHDIVAIQFADPLELHPIPKTAIVQVKDSESGSNRLIDTSNPIFRRQPTTVSAQAFCKSLGIDWLTLSLHEDYINQFLKFIQIRSERAQK